MVICRGGWSTHMIAGSSTEGIGKLNESIQADNASTALGVLGMPGYGTF